MRKLTCNCGEKLSAVSARNTDMTEYKRKFERKRSQSKRVLMNQNKYAMCGKKPSKTFNRVYKKVTKPSRFVVIFKCNKKDCKKYYTFRGPNKNLINRSITHFNKTGMVANGN